MRGLFQDDPEHPLAPLFRSERLPTAVAALNMPIAPAVVPGDLPPGVAEGFAPVSAGPGY
ncbi:hypothetical protein [Amycolatopsis thermoflava]|uniref:hypothetical protein n=1 Tax=Amycolatopsis thermoflava TaxID=84480 RepID=UPI001ADEC438|nr:hypothetical protein [Amycolatopsis thermoflava]